MTITYLCPSCHATQHQPIDVATRRLTCQRCGQAIETRPSSMERVGDRSQSHDSHGVGEYRVVRCLACPSQDLYVRKDFPQRLGVGLVAIGVVGSSIAWYHARLYWTFGILFATALVDVLLYALVGDVLMCYRCGAHYRGAADIDAHGPFNLETHEKQRQIDARAPR